MLDGKKALSRQENKINDAVLEYTMCWALANSSSESAIYKQCTSIFNSFFVLPYQYLSESSLHQNTKLLLGLFIIILFKFCLFCILWKLWANKDCTDILKLFQIFVKVTFTHDYL